MALGHSFGLLHKREHRPAVCADSPARQKTLPARWKTLPARRKPFWRAGKRLWQGGRSRTSRVRSTSEPDELSKASDQPRSCLQMLTQDVQNKQ